MRNPKCRDCELWKSSKTVCVWGDGPTDASVVIIGEAPGENEAKTGKPFTGRSGQLLRSELERAGVRDPYITNLVKCRPPDNREPTKEEIAACRKYLEAELAQIKPDFVVAAGGTASKIVLKDAKITTINGKVIENVPMSPGSRGYPIYHPAYVLRDPGKINAFRADLERLARLLDGQKLGGPDVDVKIVKAKNFRRFLKEFREAEAFSFDLETSGLFPWSAAGSIRCLSIGLYAKGEDGKERLRGWVIPGDMPDSPYAGRPAAFGRMVVLLHKIQVETGKPTRWVVGQNAKFDNNWLWAKCGVRFHLDFDTMIAHHTLDENAPHDLEVMSRSELDAPEYDIPLQEKNGTIAWKHFNAGRVDLAYESCQKVYKYAGKDAGYTLALGLKFNLRFKKDRSLRQLFYRLIMRSARALQEIEAEGLTLDMKRRGEVKEEVGEKLAGAEADLLDVANINWNAPQQVARVLYGGEDEKDKEWLRENNIEPLGLECNLLTDAGNPSTSIDALIDLKGQHPVVDKLIEYRELAKFMNTYIDGWDELIVDGKLYVGYKVTGTVTGRYSSRLHSIPRDGTIRNLGTAPPGWRFFQADISQAELRIVTEFSRDIEMMTCFTRGPDIHWRTVMHVVGSGGAGDYVERAKDTAWKLTHQKKLDLSKSLEILLKSGHSKATDIWDGWKEARKKGKAINFGFVFGMYENKFIETTKRDYGFEPTWDEAHLYRKGFFGLYTGLEPWHNRQKALCRLDGQVRNFAGRIRRLPGIHSSDREAKGEAERQSINAPVQGFIGDWKAAALVEIHETMPRDRIRLVGEHHDALLGIVREDSLHLLGEVRRIMKDPAIIREDLGVKLVVPMESEIEVGNWGAGKAWTDDLKKVKK